MILLITTQIFLLLIIIILSLQFYNIIFRGLAPYISTKIRNIKKIVTEIENDNLNLDNNKIVYELGCGQSLFLRALEKKFQHAKLIGVECLIFPYLISQIKNKLRKSKIILLRQNFLNINLKDADLIYCYLNPKTMLLLKDKFSIECKKSAIVISCNFSLPDTEPQKILRCENDKLFFYKL